jgi:hypothetical protein
MSRFWAIICAAVYFAMMGIALSSDRVMWEPPHWIRILTFYSCTGTLVIVVWASFSRSQIVQGRISLRSLFILTGMLAIWFCAIRLGRPF